MTKGQSRKVKNMLRLFELVSAPSFLPSLTRVVFLFDFFFCEYSHVLPQQTSYHHVSFHIYRFCFARKNMCASRIVSDHPHTLHHHYSIFTLLLHVLHPSSSSSSSEDCCEAHTWATLLFQFQKRTYTLSFIFFISWAYHTFIGCLHFAG